MTEKPLDLATDSIRHHWQCSWNLDQYSWECDCGLSGKRHPIMDSLPHDRAPTRDETEAAHDGCCHKTRLKGAPCPIGRDCPYIKENPEP